MSEFSTKHHYVPIWYQKRFLEPGKTTLRVLNLYPRKFTKANQTIVQENPVHFEAPASWFFEPNLYDASWAGVSADFLEKRWFGNVDTIGAVAVNGLVEDNKHDWNNKYQDLFEYLDAQRYRTPRGLAFIRRVILGRQADQGELMQAFLSLSQMHVTMWVEGAVELFETEGRDARLIFSDHPVILFNRHFFPPDKPRGFDPSPKWRGTQTLFPIDDRHLLVLTHQEGAAPLTPSQARSDRTNARFLAPTIARTDKCIRGRKLTREQVLEVNYICKMTAYRHIAGQNHDDLYPETAFKLKRWSEVGAFLFPEYSTGHGGDIFIRHNDGSVTFQDRHGRSPASKQEAEARAREAEAMHAHFLKLIRDQGEKGTNSGSAAPPSPPGPVLPLPPSDESSGAASSAP